MQSGPATTMNIQKGHSVSYENKFNSADKKLTLKYQLGEDAYSTTYAGIWGYGHANSKGEAD